MNVQDNEQKPKDFKIIGKERVEKPDWLVEGADHADVTLRGELVVGGTKVKVIRLREPEVADELAAQKGHKDEGDREIALLANLCGVTPADLHKLKSRDYRRIQFAYQYAFTD